MSVPVPNGAYVDLVSYKLNAVYNSSNVLIGFIAPNGDYQALSSSGTGAVNSVNGYTGTVVLAASDIGLGNVNNTSDVNKPVSTAQAAADAAVLSAAEAYSSNANNLTSGTVSSARLPAPVNTPVSAATSRNLASSDNNTTIQAASGITLTAVAGLTNNFACNFIHPNVAFTLASDGTVLFNGSTTSISFAAGYGSVVILPTSTADSYLVIGA